jgi:disulfide oxidoreductase YuzD
MACKNVPTKKALYSRVKSAAKRKFVKYPSAYANGWLVKEYKKRGGTYKEVCSTKKKRKKK